MSFIVYCRIIEERFSFNDIELANVRYEPTINGRPDLVVEAIDKGKKIALLVIETRARAPVVKKLIFPFGFYINDGCVRAK